MALTPQQLAAMATTVVWETDGPTHVGSGEQHDTTADDATQTGTVVNGDNHGGISQRF